MFYNNIRLDMLSAINFQPNFKIQILFYLLKDFVYSTFIICTSLGVIFLVLNLLPLKKRRFKKFPKKIIIILFLIGPILLLFLVALSFVLLMSPRFSPYEVLF